MVKETEPTGSEIIINNMKMPRQNVSIQQEHDIKLSNVYGHEKIFTNLSPPTTQTAHVPVGAVSSS